MGAASLMRHAIEHRRFVGALATTALALGAPLAGQSRPDPRVGLRAGWLDAGQAAWNLKLVSATSRAAGFVDDTTPGGYDFTNSDLAFDRTYVLQGNFHGILIWDVSRPAHPTLVTGIACPGAQNDVSVYRNLLFVSVESPAGRVDCGGQGVHDTVSADRMRGVRIFDIADVTHPRLVVNVQTCRGSHTHTLVTSPADTANVYIYVSGSAPVRSPKELAGCSALRPDQDSSSELFRIEVIQVPLAHPEQARVIGKPAILAELSMPPAHGEEPADLAEARAHGAYIAKIYGVDRVAPSGFVSMVLDSLVQARGGSGAPTAADSAALRRDFQLIVDRIGAAENPTHGPRPGPIQCHDITAYPALGIAGGACAGYGLLLDIRDPTRPRRLAAVADSNFSFWHSATFNNDGTKILFTDEWGGGVQARCRVTDDPKWGADAIFTVSGGTLAFRSYYKLPAPQTAEENCVAHNGSLIPVPGRDIMVQSWYQGGISVFDWTDPAQPREIAFFDRGPMDSTRLETGGSWSAYWYNGFIISSEIGRGLDILDLLPSRWLTQNEIDAAKLIHVDQLNVQDQQRLVWPARFVVARAYLDQLARHGLAAARVAAARSALTRAERTSGVARRTALNRLAADLNGNAAAAADPAKVRTLAEAVSALAQAP